jgi:hypothetical protein
MKIDAGDFADRGRVFPPTLAGLGDILIEDVRDTLERERAALEERESNPLHQIPESTNHVRPSVENERGVAEAFDQVGAWAPQYKADKSETEHVSKVRADQIGLLLPNAARRAETMSPRLDPDSQKQVYQLARLENARDKLAELETFMEVQMEQIIRDMAERLNAEAKKAFLMGEITYFRMRVERIVAEVQGITLEKYYALPFGLPQREKKATYVARQGLLDQQLQGIINISRSNDVALNIAMTSLDVLMESGRGDITPEPKSDSSSE